jgi:hypothetical protein
MPFMSTVGKRLRTCPYNSSIILSVSSRISIILSWPILSVRYNNININPYISSTNNCWALGFPSHKLIHRFILTGFIFYTFVIIVSIITTRVFWRIASIRRCIINVIWWQRGKIFTVGLSMYKTRTYIIITVVLYFTIKLTYMI